MFFSKKKKEEPKAATRAAAPQAPAPQPARPVPQTAAPAQSPPAAAAVPPPPVAAPATGAAAAEKTSTGAGRHPHHVLGQIAGLMISSPRLQYARLSDLSWLALPAIRSNQVAVAEARDASGNLVPVAAIVWAKVSLAVDLRLASDTSYPPRLQADEWTSGDIPWVVMAVGSEKACQATIDEISKTMFGGRQMKSNVPIEGMDTAAGRSSSAA